jgi:hypothetical protein
VRLPKFQDSRKNKANPVFTGWTDDSETGQSPLSSLFSKIVPFMQVATRPWCECCACQAVRRFFCPYSTLKHCLPCRVCARNEAHIDSLRTRRILNWHRHRMQLSWYLPMMLAQPGSRSSFLCIGQSNGSQVVKSQPRPELTDLACAERTLVPVEAHQIDALAKHVQHRMISDNLKTEAPIKVETDVSPLLPGESTAHFS